MKQYKCCNIVFCICRVPCYLLPSKRACLSHPSPWNTSSQHPIRTLDRLVIHDIIASCGKSTMRLHGRLLCRSPPVCSFYVVINGCIIIILLVSDSIHVYAFIGTNVKKSFKTQRGRIPIRSSNGVLWPSGLMHWTQVLVLSECEFESWPGRSQRLCPWARHLTIIASSFGWDVKL